MSRFYNNLALAAENYALRPKEHRDYRAMLADTVQGADRYVLHYKPESTYQRTMEALCTSPEVSYLRQLAYTAGSADLDVGRAERVARRGRAAVIIQAVARGQAGRAAAAAARAAADAVAAAAGAGGGGAGAAGVDDGDAGDGEGAPAVLAAATAPSAAAAAAAPAVAPAGGAGRKPPTHPHGGGTPARAAQPTAARPAAAAAAAAASRDASDSDADDGEGEGEVIEARIEGDDVVIGKRKLRLNKNLTKEAAEAELKTTISQTTGKPLGRRQVDRYLKMFAAATKK